jgi:hypothetical protein
MTLIGHWKLEDNAPSTAVVASVGSAGTLIGAGNTNASSVVGPGGQLPLALTFDGTNDYVGFGNVQGFERTAVRSFTFWMRAASVNPASNRPVIGKRFAGGNSFRGWSIAQRGDVANDPLEFALCSNSTNNILAVRFARPNDTDWHHISITYDGSSTPEGVVAFVDAVSASLTTASNSLSASIITTASFNIATANNGGGWAFFAGDVADVRIYDHILTQGEINSLVSMSHGFQPWYVQPDAGRFVE